jgi:PhzF family phenazine biosynthesis protein
LAPPVHRYAAFTDDPRGGNPAGVVLEADGMSDEEMLAVAADLGYSETAFLAPGHGDDDYRVRYFSPLAEIPFCGHATIAAAVALGRSEDLVFHTMAGDVPVSAGGGTATLTSVEPSVAAIDPADFEELLAALGWPSADLDPSLPPRVAYAGIHSPVIAAATRERLRDLDYDFDRLGRLMAARDWTTISLVWRERPDLLHARDPFPPGGIFEDPATGAAAAGLGGYLRALGLVEPPATVTILQGEDLGRPSRLTVDIRAGSGGIAVTGAAVPM